MAGSYHSIWIAVGSRDGTTRQLTAASLAANVTSTSNLFTGMLPQASATFTVESGTPTGTYILEQTNDLRAEDVNTAASAQWNTVQSLTVTAGVFSGGGTSALVSWINGARYTRIRWVFGSGTGTGYVFVTGVST